MAARKRKKGLPAAGSKVLLTALALLGTLGGWAYLAAESATELIPTPTPQVLTLNLPPIPTLVPGPSPASKQEQASSADPTATPALRQVSQPASVGSSGGGGGAAGRTRSSR